MTINTVNMAIINQPTTAEKNKPAYHSLYKLGAAAAFFGHFGDLSHVQIMTFARLQEVI